MKQPIHFEIIAPPDDLKNDIECFRAITYAGPEAVAVRVSPSGLPGIVFQHWEGRSAIKNIVMDSGRVVHVSTLFVYGQVTEVSSMYFTAPFLTLQVIFKPHALQTVLGIDASTITSSSVDLQKWDAKVLNDALITSLSDAERTALLSDFLRDKRAQLGVRDLLIEQGLGFIEDHIDVVSVEALRMHLGLSERQLERKFGRAVGISPQLYIRIRRINEAFRLMDSKQYERLSDIAYALNFHDQSHFIRDIKAFSGITPKSISQKVVEINYDRAGFSYLI